MGYSTDNLLCIIPQFNCGTVYSTDYLLCISNCGIQYRVTYSVLNCGIQYSTHLLCMYPNCGIQYRVLTLSVLWYTVHIQVSCLYCVLIQSKCMYCIQYRVTYSHSIELWDTVQTTYSVLQLWDTVQSNLLCIVTVGYSTDCNLILYWTVGIQYNTTYSVSRSSNCGIQYRQLTLSVLYTVETLTLYWTVGIQSKYSVLYPT